MKAQAGSWNVIVASVVGVVVLLVLIAIFTGSLGEFAENSSDCENKGGICSRSCSQEKGFYQVQLSCTEELPKCCFKGEDFESTQIIVRDGS